MLCFACQVPVPRRSDRGAEVYPRSPEWVNVSANDRKWRKLLQELQFRLWLQPND